MKTGRADILASLKTAEVFDLIVIGGGATGCGAALDAASRGLKVALVEKSDFGSGTSGRSTKLIHGGVRYLEQAVLHLDRVNLGLVRDALHERAILLRIAPHLCRRLPLVVPLYRLSDILYFLAGLMVYDLLAGRRSIGSSRVVGVGELRRRFPMLRREGLKGGVMYYDGQFDDARMNVALALTALDHGAAVANYLEVADFVREGVRLAGVRVREQFTGESWDIRARCVINACGTSVDLLRRLDDPAQESLLQPSLGSHLVLTEGVVPGDMGILIPRTSDDRVLFVLPWQGRTLVGTTDRPAVAGEEPKAGEEDVDYLLQHLDRYFHLGAEQRRVLASWAGLRPLVRDESVTTTARLHRDHLVECSRSGLITVTGGKWTTYRRMAKDAVDRAIREAGLSPLRECRTESIMLHGGKGYGDKAPANAPEPQNDADLALHLRRYGDRADEVAGFCRGAGAERLVPCYPYLKGEVLYAVRHELALRPGDFLARRIPLALIDAGAAREAASAVLELMARELEWDDQRVTRERAALPSP